IRFAYRAGDLIGKQQPQIIVARLPHGFGHSTRDLVFSNDGKQMFVSVGSASNDGGNLSRQPSPDLKRWDAEHGLGAAWGSETERADVLVFNPDGKDRRIFAAG